MELTPKFFIRFLKNWTLPVAIVAGIVFYIVYENLPFLASTRASAARTVAIIQPLLIFSMLFITFCKVDARNLRLRIRHLWMLLFQCGLFVLGALLLHFMPTLPGRLVLESALLCIVCPTATAASVVTMKLNGDAADIMSYTLLINLAVALIVPLCIPLIHPQVGQTFLTSFALILCKVFPLLIFPLLAAQLLRFWKPNWVEIIAKVHNLAFYLWAVALCLAIVVTCRSIAHATHPFSELVAVAVASLICCAIQFAWGHYMGQSYNKTISTAQAMGQKNTVFAIWMGYTFLNPVTSLAGGFYSIWHNLYNTYQLARQRRTGESH